MLKRSNLKILQYNVYKFRNKVMIALLQKRKIQKYNILVIQESWRFCEKAKTYNLDCVNFTLKNNDEKICFYINKRIDSNN